MKVFILLWMIRCISADVVYVDPDSRIECFPERPYTDEACLARGCGVSHDSTYACFFPIQCGYILDKQAGSGNNLDIDLITGSFQNPYGDNISPLKFRTTMIGSTMQVIIGNDDRWSHAAGNATNKVNLSSNIKHEALSFNISTKNVRYSCRFVPPLDLPRKSSPSFESLSLDIGTISNSSYFSFQVKRDSTNTVLLDTNVGGMMFSDQFIQFGTFLPSKNVYGFGENVHQTLRHDMDVYTTWPMFARDIAPDSSSPISIQNLMGVHPFYMVVENDSQAHGVLFFNSNAQEVMTGPHPHLVYRSIGGRLEIAIFPGPKPEDVIQQYLAYIARPYLPPYWALGYQLCRFGYKDVSDMKAAITRTQQANIPIDVAHADIDYMDNGEDFTLGPGWQDFPAYADELHSEGMHLSIIMDPSLQVDLDPFRRAMEHSVSFIEWDTDNQVPRSIQDQYPLVKDTNFVYMIVFAATCGINARNGSLASFKIMLGNEWENKNAAYPDFLDLTSNTTDWYIGEFSRFRNHLAFDAIWLNMNEPSNFGTYTYTDTTNPATAKLACPISGVDGKYDNPPYPTNAVFYLPINYLCEWTLCLVGLTSSRTQRFYDTKNLYSWAAVKTMFPALHDATTKRGNIMARSSFVSSGRYAGHNLIENQSQWADLRTSIIHAMEFNMFGIPYVGSTICGMSGDATEELCLRWHQLGAFYTLSWNHNSPNTVPQDPAQWPSVANATRIAFNFRYKYLPYLYSLHYKASRFGGTVVRPVFFEFPQDLETLALDYQFMWGEAFMISPVTTQGDVQIHTYFPADIWYGLMPENYGTIILPGFNDIPAPWTSLTPVFVRGGYIIPRQFPNTTTTTSRLNPFELLVTTGTTISMGELYYDFGDDIVPPNIEDHKRHHWQFIYAPYPDSGTYTLTGNCEKCDSTVVIPTLDTIELFGLEQSPNFASFYLNGVKVNIDVRVSSYSQQTQIAVISTKGLINLNKFIQNSFTLSWSAA